MVLQSLKVSHPRSHLFNIPNRFFELKIGCVNYAPFCKSSHIIVTFISNKSLNKTINGTYRATI